MYIYHRSQFQLLLDLFCQQFFFADEPTHLSRQGHTTRYQLNIVPEPARPPRLSPS